MEWEIHNEVHHTILEKWGCDPKGLLNTRFPDSICIKEGELDLRIDDEVHSISEIHHLKKKWICVFCIWIASAIPVFMTIIGMVLCVIFENCINAFEYVS